MAQERSWKRVTHPAKKFPPFLQTADSIPTFRFTLNQFAWIQPHWDTHILPFTLNKMEGLELKYSDVLAGNTSNNLLILDSMLDLLVIHQAELQLIITLTISPYFSSHAIL
jgi:hypothetical protein